MTEQNKIPHPGQLVLIRNRPAIVTDIKESKSEKIETVHGVWFKYIDGFTHPENDFIIWEREYNTAIIQTAKLPKIEKSTFGIDDPDIFRALINAYRWSSNNSIYDLFKVEGSKSRIFSPWQSAVQIEDYQLYPVLKALNMPRITMLIADDVGLGKTIEAGLILSELFARGRLRRVLIICPAALQVQWRDEMAEKFYIDFNIVDRESTFKLQKEFGIDSNPWNSFPRIITSLDYLRQRDVLESFNAATKNFIRNNGLTLPWDMIIVDEAHNIAPKYFNSETERIRMLRQILPHFEHRIFLTATPHNGFTSSFTGMLELLNSLKFEQKNVLEESDRNFIKEHVIRRLKSELNKDSLLKRFASRTIKRINPNHKLYPKEIELFNAVRAYRQKVLDLLADQAGPKKYIVSFLVTLLTKRLLSSSYAFAKTWWNHYSGLDNFEVDDEEARFIIQRVESDIIDDNERDLREEEAAKKIGSWLAQNADKFRNEINEINRIISAMGWTSETINDEINCFKNFPKDSKWDSIISWINSNLKNGNNFKTDERVIIFTEYKHTLDYLVSRFKAIGIESPILESMFGGSGQSERERIKLYFNDVESNLRILIATDVASEGINLQNNCRFIIHYEIPWNPIRLEQRNGRVDRYGQLRDVTIFHFTTDEEADLKFLERVINKVEQIREDLGGVGELFDKTIENYFTGVKSEREIAPSLLESIQPNKDEKEELRISDKGSDENYQLALQNLRLTENELNINSKSLGKLLQIAFRLENGDLLEDDKDSDVFRIVKIPPRWKNLIDSSIRIKTGKAEGSLPRLVFDGSYFEKVVNGRKIYLTKPDTKLIRLGHPIMKRAIGLIRKKLWELPEFNPSQSLSRFTVTKRVMPSGTNQLLIVYLLIEAINDLRESIHTEVITLKYQLDQNKLLNLDDNLFVSVVNMDAEKLPKQSLNEWIPKIRTQWLQIEHNLNEIISQFKNDIESKFSDELKSNLDTQIELTKKSYDERIKELKKKKEPKFIEKLRKEFAAEKLKLNQEILFEDMKREKIKKIEEMEQNLERHRDERLAKLQKNIEDEKERMLNKILPARYKLNYLEVIPLGVEICLNSKLFGENKK